MKEKATKRNIFKRVMGVLLAASLVLTMQWFPGVTETVYAAEPTAPGGEAYQSDINDIETGSKVIFGPSYSYFPRKWYVCGTEDDALVLICLPTLNFGTCGYATGACNYQTSNLNSKISGLCTSGSAGCQFTDAEIGLMKDVEISYPEDASNPTGSQSTLTCKMYAANAKCYSDGTYESGTILVGKGVGAIELSTSSFVSSGSYSLRTIAPTDPSTKALYVSDTNVVGAAAFNSNMQIVPVFHLDSSKALFSSTAAAATANANLDANGYFTIRFKDSETSPKITSSATANASGISVTNPTSGEYLYVQWNDGANNKVKSFALNTATTSITAAQIGVDMLTEDCKIWIEKKDTTDNLVYAKNVEMPVEIKGITVKSDLTTTGIAYTGQPVTTSDIFTGTPTLGTEETQATYTWEGTGSTEYESSATAPSAPGTYKLVISAVSTTKQGTKEIDFNIVKAVPSADKFVFTASDTEELVYDGTAKAASVTSKDGVAGLGNVEKLYYMALDLVTPSAVDENWTTSAPVDAGTYKVKVDVAEGVGYEAVAGLTSDFWTFTISPKSLEGIAEIAPIEDQTWTGSAIKPEVSVVIDGGTLEKDEDYTVSYTNNADAGTATAVVTGIGNYTGTLTADFNIVKDTVDALNVTVTPTPTSAAGVKTGDNNNQLLFIILLIAAAAAIVITVCAKRRSRR